MSLRMGWPVSNISSLERGIGARFLKRSTAHTAISTVFQSSSGNSRARTSLSFCHASNGEIASCSRHPTLLFNKLRCSQLCDEKIVHNQPGRGLEFIGTREPIFDRFCPLFSHHQQIICPCGDAGSDDGTENDSHETDNRLIHIFNPFGCRMRSKISICPTVFDSDP